MTTKLIIARHGNTFKPGEMPTRVGAKTDLPLVENRKGKSIGKYLKENHLMPDIIFSGPLKRQIQTAELAIDEMGIDLKIQINNDFTEIDYGPDENKTEDDVIKRIGQEAINHWNEKAVVPKGWKVNPDQIIKSWMNFSNFIETEYKNKTILIVSSNGIIRFAPYITGDFDAFIKQHPIKVSTGGLCIFEKFKNDQYWKCREWNVKPL